MMYDLFLLAADESVKKKVNPRKRSPQKIGGTFINRTSGRRNTAPLPEVKKKKTVKKKAEEKIDKRAFRPVRMTREQIEWARQARFDGLFEGLTSDDPVNEWIDDDGNVISELRDNVQKERDTRNILGKFLYAKRGSLVHDLVKLYGADREACMLASINQLEKIERLYKVRHDSRADLSINKE